MKLRAAIQTQDGKTIPVFAGRKATYFRSQQKAVRKLESLRIPGRGFIWQAGTSLADTDISNVYTIAL